MSDLPSADRSFSDVETRLSAAATLDWKSAALTLQYQQYVYVANLWFFS
jgi:hypothetical protein